MFKPKFIFYILYIVLAFLSIIPDLKGQFKTVKFQFAPINRAQIAGPHSLILPNHFQYLNIFNQDNRFAPDEPSSFSSIEYFFKERQVNENIKLNWSIGLFRNHIKGDIILDESNIHFGRGNSHFGFSSSLNFSKNIFSSNYTVSYFNQLGVGPLVTRFENEENNVFPDKWGVNGYGVSGNIGIELQTPRFLKHIAIHFGILFNFSWIKMNELSISEFNQKFTYSNLHFVAINKLPAINIGFSYTIQNTNN